MSDHAFDFLQSWIVENVNATMHEDKDAVEHLAHDRVWEAKTRAFEGRGQGTGVRTTLLNASIVVTIAELGQYSHHSSQRTASSEQSCFLGHNEHTPRSPPAASNVVARRTQ
jgi:hypothetical protein